MFFCERMSSFLTFFIAFIIWITYQLNLCIISRIKFQVILLSTKILKGFDFLS